MKHKRPATLILFFVLVAFVLIVARLIAPQTEFHARGHFLIRPPIDDIRANWFQVRFGEISNVLCSSQTIDRLATISHVSQSDFKLTALRPLRSTLIIGVEYSGTSSNGVQCVASNACEILFEFYRTNRPSLTATNLGASVFEPPRFWDKTVRRLESLLP